MAVGQELYDQHVFFDNSAADRADYHSAASAVAPSEIEIVDGKCPVESAKWKSPGNSLRLKWRSAQGGDWPVSINAATQYGRRFQFVGDELSFWVAATTSRRARMAQQYSPAILAGRAEPLPQSMNGPKTALAQQREILYACPHSSLKTRSKACQGH